MSETTVLRIPKLYENMDEATIGEWLVAEGDVVKKGDALIELVTDKTTETVETPVDGTLLKRYATEKSVIPMGFVYACIGPKGATAPDVSVENEALTTSSAIADAVSVPEPSKSVPKKRVRIAPAARALAKRHGLNLDELTDAVGKDVIHKQDVEALLQAEPEPTPAPPNPIDKTDKVILITGASGDIGRTIARRLGADGFRLALHFHRNREPVDELLEEFKGLGIDAKGYSADLTDSAAVTLLIETITDDFSNLYGVVHTAGALNDSLTGFMSDDQWHSIMKLNLDSAFFLSRAVAMHMVRAREGRIVFISSAAARLGSAGRSNYAAAKSALLGLTRSLARELAASQVLVNAVCPGFIESRMTAGYKDVKKRELMKEVPLRRFGRPEEVAEVIAFLVAPTTTYVTGQSLSVDGGLYMG